MNEYLALFLTVKQIFFATAHTIIVETLIHIIVVHLTFPHSSFWTSVDHHEALAALSNWSYFHLTEKSVQLFSSCDIIYRGWYC